MSDLTDLTIAAVRRALRNKEFTALELADAYLAAMERARILNAYVAETAEQVGAAQKAWRNSTPWSARSWMFGVGTWKPYGCTYRPVSCEWI